MNVVVSIPGELAPDLCGGGDPARRMLEAFAIEEYRADRLAAPAMGLLLGFEIRCELDAFLKAHGVFYDYMIEDLREDRRTLARLDL